MLASCDADTECSLLHFRESRSFVHRNMVGLVALNLVLRLIGTGVVGVSFVVHVFAMHLDDSAADVASLGIPRHMVADMEVLRAALFPLFDRLRMFLHS